MSNSFIINSFVETKDINDKNIQLFLNTISTYFESNNMSSHTVLNNQYSYTSASSDNFSLTINFILKDKGLSSLDAYINSFTDFNKYDIIEILKSSFMCFDMNYIRLSRDPDMKKDQDGLANMEMSLHVDGAKGKIMRYIKNGSD